MPSVVNLGLLTRAEQKIKKHDLHSLGLHPVPYDPVLEEVRRLRQFYVPYPPVVQATLSQWKSRRQTLRVIAYNEHLKEPSESAMKRAAAFHEYCHIFCRHRGEFFAMLWQAGEPPAAFDLYLDDLQERQCQHMSAFFAVPQIAMIELWRESREYVAGLLDVPHYLVELRWEIWRKFGR